MKHEEAGHSEVTHLTGRVHASPSALLHREVLAPQFAYEVQYLLPWYVEIEQVLLLEFERMSLLDRKAAVQIASALRTATAEALIADPKANMSDISFALEKHVSSQLDAVPSMWHVDRSRNDFQSCAQLMLARSELLKTIPILIEFASAVLRQAQQSTQLPMPGYTHFQAAQVISPGFYLSAVLQQSINTLSRLAAIYDEINASPIGSGAMAGQELPWDRRRMANLLGFDGPLPHALMGVASREWALRISAEFSLLGVALSRFATDFMLWGSSEYGFIDLPDEMSGISSAMPQKKNYPVLERIRGKTAHISAFHVDFLTAQRNTPYSNLVEVSKEAGANLIPMFNTVRSALRLFTAVMEHVQFRTQRMRAACEREYLGGFTLANRLAIREHIPYRQAQVLAGRYIVEATAKNRLPCEVDGDMLAQLCQQAGYAIEQPAELLREVFDVDANLRAKNGIGSTHPEQVTEMLGSQQGELERLQSLWEHRQNRIHHAQAHLQDLLSVLVGGAEA